jgi:hypothetical protein
MRTRKEILRQVLALGRGSRQVSVSAWIVPTAVVDAAHRPALLGYVG